MLSLVLDTLLPGDTALNAPPASLIDFEAYQNRFGIHEQVGNFLKALGELAQQRHAMQFESLDIEQRLQLVDALRRQDLRLFTQVVTHCLRAYYSSEVVLRGLSSGAVPPFPEGNVLPGDDWSLLEPVYLRGPAYRPVDTSTQ
jgi:hypothetical protein